MRIAGAGRIVASVPRIGQGTLEQSTPKKSEDSASQHESPCFHFSRSIPPSLFLSLSPSLSSPRLLFFSTSTRLTPSRYQLILRRVDDPNSRVSTCLRPGYSATNISPRSSFRNEIPKRTHLESRVSWSDTPRATT